MSKPAKVWSLWPVFLYVGVIALLMGNCAHTFATCDGHVVRNFLDWPVCIR